MLSLQPASGDAPGWSQRFIYGPVGRFVNFALGWIPRGCKAALGLSGEERQTLMSWGLLGGVIVLTALQFWTIREMYHRWNDTLDVDLQRQVIDGLFSELTWLTVLQGVLVIGIVAIAKGGALNVSITKAGATMDFAASGTAAKNLASESANLMPETPLLPAPKPAVPAPAATPAPAAATDTYKGPDLPPPAPGTPENAQWSR